MREVEKSRGRGSVSQRVNTLLKIGLASEKRVALRREVSGFFSGEERDPSERMALHRAALRSISRGEE